MAEYTPSSVRNYPLSDLINVRDFLSKWDSDDLYKLCAEESENRRLEIAQRMKVDDEETIKELETVCSLDHMRSDDDITQTEQWKLLEVIPEDTDLMALRFQKYEIEKRKHDFIYSQNILRKMKYKKEDGLAVPPNLNKVEIPEEYRVIYPDVLIEVIIHRPIKIRDVMMKESALKNQVLSQSGVIQVIGRQKITDLRDVVRCVYDLTVSGELSENPDTENHMYAKDIFKSGFFFIEGVFYNDMREPESLEYSQPIIDWCKKKNIGKYETKKMEDFTFLDLTVKLGKPYLYMHQGDCEHILIFSDIRLLERTDIQDTREYPYLSRKYRKHRTMCRACCAQSARWITYGSSLAPENPCFFCDVCYKALHYDTNNKKIGSFEAYKYFDHHAIM